MRFSPATAADKAALEALVPANATNVDDLPQFIGSGIKVIPELLVNGKVLLTGSPMAIAKEVQLGYKPRLPNINQQRPAMTYDIIAGSYLHIPIVGYSVNPYQLLDTKKRVEATQKILESKDQNQLKTLTREQIFGDIFYTGGLGYFAQLHTMNRMASHYGATVSGALSRAMVAMGMSRSSNKPARSPTPWVFYRAALPPTCVCTKARGTKTAAKPTTI